MGSHVFVKAESIVYNSYDKVLFGSGTRLIVTPSKLFLSYEGIFLAFPIPYIYEVFGDY